MVWGSIGEIDSFLDDRISAISSALLGFNTISKSFTLYWKVSMIIFFHEQWNT